MGQGTIGHGLPRRLYHTQEIAHQPSVNEWKSLGHWTVEVEESDSSTFSQCKEGGPFGAICCTADEGTCPVEEVLVVHHDALKKVNFLLRVDEMSGCDLPVVPECVIAARRAELQRRHMAAVKTSFTDLAGDDAARGSSAGPAPGVTSRGARFASCAAPCHRQPGSVDSDSEAEPPSADVGCSGGAAAISVSSAAATSPAAASTAGGGVDDAGLAASSSGLAGGLGLRLRQHGGDQDVDEHCDVPASLGSGARQELVQRLPAAAAMGSDGRTGDASPIVSVPPRLRCCEPTPQPSSKVKAEAYPANAEASADDPGCDAGTEGESALAWTSTVGT